MSPFELLIFRKVKDKLPITDELLTPKMYNIVEVQEKLKQMQTKNKSYYDKDTQSLPDCNLGDDVYFKIDKNDVWKRGRIADKCDVPRSYVVKDTDNNAHYRRSREHIKLCRSGVPDNTYFPNIMSQNCTNSSYGLRNRRTVLQPVRYRT
uniref:Uncharacterized protein n=1 Tax=Cacopsylla melanoneura TaxID=428564 RepID=A0A8D8LMU9_9HEMI